MRYFVVDGDRVPAVAVIDLTYGELAEFQEVSGLGIAEIVDPATANDIRLSMGLVYAALRRHDLEADRHDLADRVRGLKLGDVTLEEDDADPPTSPKASGSRSSRTGSDSSRGTSND